MTDSESFSRRFGFRPHEAEITIREDAPDFLRAALAETAYDVGLQPSTVRKVVCRVLRVRPDESNWSERPNIAYEVDSRLSSCDWYQVYDVAEALYGEMARTGIAEPTRFESQLNEVFREGGIGWQMVEGRIQVRGQEEFEAALRHADTALAKSGRGTARSEIHEALHDLSRRPDPDLTGALQHAMAALECVARDVTGDSRATLGEIIARYPGRIPRPLDTAVEKAWGYASERARHLREGGTPTHEEVELVVGIAASVASYLARKGG